MAGGARIAAAAPVLHFSHQEYFMIRFASLARAACFGFSVLAFAPASFAAGHIVYKFSLPPGGTKTISLPVIQVPVRLAASVSFENNGTLTPSELVSAVVNQDPKSGQVTWIGTNGDGSQAAGNTLSATQVAAFGFSDATVTAAAGTGSTAGTLTINQSSSETSIPGTYWIVLTY
jgi:hypothetical protein